LITTSLGFVLSIFCFSECSANLDLLYKKGAPISLAGIGPDHLRAILLAAACGKMSHAQF
jgi:hypothetical protein